MNRFLQALDLGRTLVLDGGLATQLEAAGHGIDTSLWSAALLRDRPEAIVGAHRAFLEAGAHCIISASYQASRKGFQSSGLSPQAADRLIASATALARQARREYLEAHPQSGFTPLVAASIGPYGAALHDGSEYRGDYGVDRWALRDFHAHRLPLLDASGADLLACETIPDRVEAEVLSELLHDVATPAWVSFSCRDEQHISDGTPLAAAVAPFAGHPRVRAVGVNCTAPHLVTALIHELRAAVPDAAVVVYPNSGETYATDGNAWSGPASQSRLADMALEWHAAGARLIGGCCRIGPAQIAEIRHALNDFIPA